MQRRVCVVGVVGRAWGGAATAADAVMVPPLGDFKWKAAFEGGAELGGYDTGEDRFFFYTNGAAAADVTIPEDGEYTITIEASCSEAEKELAKFKVTCIASPLCSARTDSSSSRG